MIIDQIKEREVQRMKEREAIEKEQAQMVRVIEQGKKQDQEQQELKKKRNEQVQKEIEAANRIAQQKK